MPRVVSARTKGAYDLDLANIGRLRQRLMCDSRVTAEKLKELVQCIDIVMIGIRPFLSDDTDV